MTGELLIHDPGKKPDSEPKRCRVQAAVLTYVSCFDGSSGHPGPGRRCVQSDQDVLPPTHTKHTISWQNIPKRVWHPVCARSRSPSAANATTCELWRNPPEATQYRRYPATFVVDPGSQPPIMLTPRPTTSAIVNSEISDCAMMQSLACRERIIVSVALKAVEILKARNR